MQSVPERLLDTRDSVAHPLHGAGGAAHLTAADFRLDC